jgi:hypothetical protein
LNYYENVVVDYLRADRALFLNTQYCIQLNKADNPDTSGPHWYCDVLALDFRSKTIFLCEVSFASGLADLTNRLHDWHEHWGAVREAIERESRLSETELKGWSIRPWVFIRKDHVDHLNGKLKLIANGQGPQFEYKITPLEDVQPWLYRSWNRIGQ